MALIRTFIAIECSDRLCDACGSAIRELEPVVDGARWVRHENIHLTLKFLGDVEDRELHTVCQQLESVTQGWDVFSVACRGIGAFPNVDKPNTIWIGIEDPDEALVKLQMAVAESFAQLGFPVERRPYKPHITLGRTRTRRFQRPEWQQMVDRYAKHEFGLLKVDNVTVFSSELERRGPTYTPLARYPIPPQSKPELL